MAALTGPSAGRLRELMPDVRDRETDLLSDARLYPAVERAYGREAAYLRSLVEEDGREGSDRVSVRLAALVAAVVSDAVEQERERVRTALDDFLRGLDADPLTDHADEEQAR